jgi:serine/threonine protein kinase
VDTGLYIGPDNAPDRYRLLRSIGRGGEAVLYLAELELSGGAEPVVVKVLDARQTLSQELFSRISEKWREQAELLRFMHRLGVVGIREHFEGPSAHLRGAGSGGTGHGPGAGRALYLVMNHVEGLDLRDWRAERTLATPAERREAVRCLEQLADVLDWLHGGAATPSGRTVVHGDLSPGNVMIDAHGQATLVDFGLSKLAADHQTAEVWFTPGFAAPEVFDGKRSPATDRYAFGAMAYFLLSGESPATMSQTLRASMMALPEFAGLAPDKAAGIAAIFANDPADRPSSLTAWVRELRPVVISTTTKPRPARAPAPPLPAHAPVVPAPVPAPPAQPPAQPHAQPAAAFAAPQVPAPVAQPPAAAAAPAPEAAAQAAPVPAAPPPARPAPAAAPAASPDIAASPAQAPAPADRGPALPPSPYAPQAPQPAPPPSAYPPAAAQPAEGRAETGKAADGAPTVLLGAAALPPDDSEGGGRRSRTPQIVLAALVAVLLVGAGAYAGVALSGGGGHRSAASGPGHGATTSHSAPPSAPATSTAQNAASGAPSGDPTATGSTPTGPSTATPGQGDSLTEIDPADSSYFGLESGAAAVNGVTYDDALRTTDCDGGYAEYNLGRTYATFDVVLGLDDNSKNLPMTITVLADGVRLTHDRVGVGQSFHRVLKVQGALRLRIEWASDSDSVCGVGVLAVPTLTH